MLCPSCGTDVGNSASLCTICARAAERPEPETSRQSPELLISPTPPRQREGMLPSLRAVFIGAVVVTVLAGWWRVMGMFATSPALEAQQFPDLKKTGAFLKSQIDSVNPINGMYSNVVNEIQKSRTAPSALVAPSPKFTSSTDFSKLTGVLKPEDAKRLKSFKAPPPRILMGVNPKTGALDYR